MSLLPTRRVPNLNTHPRSQHHQLHIPNASPSPPHHHTPHPSHSLLGYLRARLSRRIRLLVLIGLLYLGWLYWFPLKTYSQSWRAILALRPASPSGAMPVVPRVVLDRLAKLEESLLTDDEREAIRLDRLTQPDPEHALPLVTALPGPRPRPAPDEDPALVRVQRGCPAGLPTPCRFVLAGFVGEQETKAQMHIYQLGLLARSLNRTLVLPQVSNSRMGSCLGYPFELYYSGDALSALGLPTLPHADFLSWAGAVTQAPSARLVALLDRKQIPPGHPKQVVFYQTTHPHHHLSFKPDRDFCVSNSQTVSSKRKLSFNFKPFAPLTIAAPDRWPLSAASRDSFAGTVLEALRKSDLPQETSGNSVPDVLVFNYELRYSILDPSTASGQQMLSLSTEAVSAGGLPGMFAHFAYAPVWVELANAIVNQLPPLVGVHWRQETIPVARLQGCMKSLVVTLGALKKSYPSLEAVYLSTDYPLEEIAHPSASGASRAAHSGTFSKLLEGEHHRVMKELMGTKLALKLSTFEGVIERLQVSDRLVEQLSKLPNMAELARAQSLVPGRLRTPATEREMVQDSLRSLDHGLVGILEKMILIRANAFLTGVPNECSKASSFTRQIVDSRERAMNDRGGMDGDYSNFVYESLPERKQKLLNLVEYWAS